MRILYLSQYFPPEAGATQTRSHEIARTLTTRGHQVTLICEFPNHPSGIIPPQYRKRLYEITKLDGIRVIRVPVLVSPKKNFITRMLFYTSFMLTAVAAGIMLAGGKFDLIYATSPPLFTGAAGLILSKWKRRPLVFEVRDLWPESAVALGEITNRSVIRLAYTLERVCYTHARRIVAVTEGFRLNLIGRGVPEGKITVIPNGASLNRLQFDLVGRQEIRDQLGLQDKFVALYAGIFGIAQGLETLLEAARLLALHPEFHLLMLGAGPLKSSISAMAAENHLANVTILPEVPLDSMSGYLSAADICMVPLKNLEVFREVIPSKIFDAWACQRPVLHTVDGEARQLVDKAGGGLFVPPDNPVLLASTLESLLTHRSQLTLMGANGLAHAEKHFSRQVLAERLAALLEKEFGAK